MKPSSHLSIGILGAGHWGLNILRNFANHPRVSVKYVCDPSETALARAQQLFPGNCTYVSNSAVVTSSPAVDAVVVVTPTSTHFDLVKQSLEAGKHVYCEKPLATVPHECAQLTELAEKTGRKLMVGFTFLFNSGILKTKELIASGSLGDIYYLTSTRTHLGLIRNDVSSIWDLAPHDVSIMNFLLGSVPERVSAIGATPLRSGNEDFGFINLFYPDGIVGQIHVSWVNSSKERQLKIIGSKARVEFDDLNLLEPVRLFQKGIGFAAHVEPDFGRYKYLLRDGDIVSPKIETREPLAQMTDAFARLVLDGETNLADGRFALDITRVLFAAHESMKEHGSPKSVADF